MYSEFSKTSMHTEVCHVILPNEFIVFFESFIQLFSPLVWRRAHTLVIDAILCRGHRTVAFCVRTVGLGKCP